jgi:hypothetical protein
MGWLSCRRVRCLRRFGSPDVQADRSRVDMRRPTRGPKGEVLTPEMGSGDDLVAAWVEEVKGAIVLTARR